MMPVKFVFFKNDRDSANFSERKMTGT